MKILFHKIYLIFFALSLFLNAQNSFGRKECIYETFLDTVKTLEETDPARAQRFKGLLNQIDGGSHLELFGDFLIRVNPADYDQALILFKRLQSANPEDVEKFLNTLKSLDRETSNYLIRQANQASDSGGFIGHINTIDKKLLDIKENLNARCSGNQNCFDIFRRDYLKGRSSNCIRNIQLCKPQKRLGRLFNEYVEFFENGSRFRPKVKRSGVADLFNGESLIEYCTSLPAGCGRSWLNNTKAKIESLPPTPINRNVSIMGQDRPQIVTDSIRYDLYNGVEKPSAPNWDYQTKYSRIEEDVTVLQGQSQAWYRQWAPGADKRTNGRQRTIRPKEAGAEKRGINPDDTHWRYSRDSDEFRHGGTFYDNEPVKLPCHRRKGGKPCTGKNSPFREFDVGVHPDWRPGDPRTGHRGGGRLIVNTRTGEMFLTFDHYETFYYLEGRNVFKTRPSYYVNRRTTLPEGIRVMAQ